MCAIIGSLHFQTKREFSLRPLLQLMTHRGPDETSVIEQDLWSVGLNRLAITAAHEKNTQPLWSPDKRFCFVFNGEIYSYKQVKKDLLEKNYHFKTSCDSEVLFYAYLEYGPEAFLKCQGMFACAIFDTLKKTWILVRDPLGIKPLYFQFLPTGFTFSSEIKPLLLLKKAGINRKALPHYLQRRFVLGKETLFSGIFRIQPGEIMEVSLKKDVKIKAYWTPKINSFVHKDKKKRFKEFSDQLKESVRLSSTSEVGKAVLLSGGVDSSLINVLSCPLQKESISQNKPFPSAWFFDNTYDKEEKAFAQKLSGKLGQKLYIVDSESRDFLLLPKIIEALEEPLADSIIIPTYKLMKQISQKERVVLSGEGADELLGGYSHQWLFYLFKKFHFLKIFALPIEGFFSESSLNALFPYPGKMRKEKLLKSISQLRQSGLKRYIEMSHLFDSEEIHQLFPGLLGESGFSESLYPDTHFLKDVLKFDIQNWLANYNLLRIDKLSMAHSLEVRVPYLNVNFVNACLSLPEQDIISLFTRKRILRKMAYREPLLDFKTSYRKKHPFTLKEVGLYKKGYREFIRDHLDSSFAEKWNIDLKSLNRLLEENEGYLDIQKQITSLLHLSIWTKAFF